MRNKEKQTPYIGRSTRLHYWVITIVCGIPGSLIAEYSISWIGIVFLILLAIPIIHINIGRWHDLGGSGWMTLLILIPFVNIVVPIALGFLKGEEKDNKYGPNPYLEKYSEMTK